MPYLAKLTKRVALVGRTLLVTALTSSLLASCSADSTGPDAIDASADARSRNRPTPVAKVTVSPSSLALTTGDTSTLKATARSATDSILTGRTITWSTTNSAVATVSSSGRVTARAVGSASIRATIGGVTGSSSVVVSAATPVPPTLTGVVLTPSTVTLAAGATQQFSVAGTWSDGSTTAPAVTYSALGGTVSASGLFTAGATAGLYRVIATQQGGTLADTSAITITVVAPPPPPPPPTSGLANECAAPKTGWIWCDDFDANRLTSYFEYDNAGGNFTRVSGTGNDGSYGMKARFTAGATNAGALHLAIGRTPSSYFRPVDAGTANYREIYYRVYLKNQAGWRGGGGAKLSRAFVFAGSNWSQAMIAHVWAGGDNSADENYLTLDPARGTDAAGNLVTVEYNDFAHLTWLGLTKGSNPIFSAAKVGQWHCIEAHVRLNDAGSANGVTEIWVDGTLDASKSGVNFLGSYNAYGVNAIYLENWWNAGSPVAQERYMDNFVVSTQRIGC